MTATNIDATAVRRVKEAFGTLTGGKRLKREGVQPATGSVKTEPEKVSAFTDSLSDSNPE